MAYPQPPANRNEVKRAGKRVSRSVGTSEDLALINDWRAAHGYVINTIQAWLKGHIAKAGFAVEFAQRLKRQKTVLDKLGRVTPDGKPVVSDKTSMHDFAGCRLIFEDVETLWEFRKYLRSNDVMRNVDHKFRHDLQKFDYISKPKSTGYRGIHDVIRHFPRGSDRSDSVKKPWDGLLVEVQFRTRAQHAWATAVEISDLIDRERTKFSTQETPRQYFFAIASEIIARKHEGIGNAFQSDSLEVLEDRLMRLEDELLIIDRLSVLRSFDAHSRLKRHNVLNIYLDGNDLALEVESFRSPNDAIRRATELENDPFGVNAVYVRADNPSQLKSAYRNYFNDPIDFVELLRE